jgi:hypothetical protein
VRARADLVVRLRLAGRYRSYAGGAGTASVASTVSFAVVALVAPSAVSAARHGVGLAFSSRLSAVTNALASLAASNAYASTLGGGDFLCRHIGLAVRAARTQMAIAARLGDARLFARAQLHLAYIAAATGRWRSAEALLGELGARASASRDAELEGMLVAARSHVAHAQGLLVGAAAGEANTAGAADTAGVAGGGGGDVGGVGGNGAEAGLLHRPALDFLRTVTMPAVRASGSADVPAMADSSGGRGGEGRAERDRELERERRLQALYASDPAHYDELHRLRLTAPAEEEDAALREAMALRFEEDD